MTRYFSRVTYRFAKIIYRVASQIRNSSLKAFYVYSPEPVPLSPRAAPYPTARVEAAPAMKSATAGQKRSVSTKKASWP